MGMPVAVKDPSTVSRVGSGRMRVRVGRVVVALLVGAAVLVVSGSSSSLPVAAADATSRPRMALPIAGTDP